MIDRVVPFIEGRETELRSKRLRAAADLFGTLSLSLDGSGYLRVPDDHRQYLPRYRGPTLPKPAQADQRRWPPESGSVYLPDLLQFGRMLWA
jgi:hypothetical protein